MQVHASSSTAAVSGAEPAPELGPSGVGPLRVLVLARSYPNNVLPLLGLWVEGLVRYSARQCAVKVVAPVPYCPRLPWLPEQYRKFTRIEGQHTAQGVDVYHPRFMVPPGYWFHTFESFTYHVGVVRFVDRLRQEFPFDLIHAHFTYPDGYVATRLGQRYRVPVIITEHAPWRPWMDSYPTVRRRAVWAARQAAFHIAVSNAAQETIAHFTGNWPGLKVIPAGVDASVFTLAPDSARRLPDQILFVGAIRPVKGVDVLLNAMRLLIARGRRLRLVIVGESFYANYRREYERLRRMTDELGLASQIEFAGGKPPSEVARYMQQSALLVLPSRQESLGMALVEALACGTPVVATRCGGPEDIVAGDVGVLVPPEDPEALARGIVHVLDRRRSYDPATLRAYAVNKFGLDSVATRVVELYRRAVSTYTLVHGEARSG